MPRRLAEWAGVMLPRGHKAASLQPGPSASPAGPGPVLVGIPAVEWVWTQTLEALLALKLPPGSAISISRFHTTISGKRNELVKGFLRSSGFSWLLFLDSDMAPAPDTISRLAGHGKPIIGAAYFTRLPPHTVTAGIRDQNGVRTLDSIGGKDFLRRVQWVGAGCLLVARQVLERVPPPWFDSPPEREGVGEDVYFCEKARAHGFEVWCDTNCRPGHIGVTAVDSAFVEAWNTQYPGGDVSPLSDAHGSSGTPRA